MTDKNTLNWDRLPQSTKDALSRSLRTIVANAQRQIASREHLTRAQDPERAKAIPGGFLAWAFEDADDADTSYTGSKPEYLPEMHAMGYETLVDPEGKCGPGFVLRDDEDRAIGAYRPSYREILDVCLWLIDTGGKLVVGQEGTIQSEFREARRRIASHLVWEEVDEIRQRVREEIRREVRTDLDAWTAVKKAETEEALRKEIERQARRHLDEARKAEVGNIRLLVEAATEADPATRDALLNDLRPWLKRLLSD